MEFGSEYVYLGNAAEDDEEVKVDAIDDVALSLSEGSESDEEDSQMCLLDILDTAGQEEYSSIKDLYCKEANAFFIVYSVTDPGSFSEAEAIYKWLKRLKDGQEMYAVRRCFLAFMILS